MSNTTVKKEDKIFTIFQTAHKIILKGDIAQADVDMLVTRCLKAITEQANTKVIIDMQHLNFIDLAAIRSIIQFIITHEQLNFLFIVNEYKTWQKPALSAILTIGNVDVRSEA